MPSKVIIPTQVKTQDVYSKLTNVSHLTNLYSILIKYSDFNGNANSTAWFQILSTTV